MTVIKSHGLEFNVEGSGFVRANASADFEQGVAEVARQLDALSADACAALHAASLVWVAADCEGDRPSTLDAIENAAHDVATRDWRSPEAVIISVSAAK